MVSYRLLVVALAVVALNSWRCGIREDELRCEEAVARLQECCPSFAVEQIDCAYYTSCGRTHHPDIDYAESRCIVATDCAAVRANKLCERAVGGGVVVDPDGGVRTGICP